jgi:hypothetical protein
MVDAKKLKEPPPKITSADVEHINRLLDVLRPFDYATNLVRFLNNY